MIKVSVIVPVYNVADFLNKCLISLVQQTLQELEIIVVNDGSTDISDKIIKDFQDKFPLKIKSFTTENSGLSAARNFGLEHATGEFIGFVDGDDEVSKTMFEDLYSLAKKNDADIVICNLQKVDDAGNITQKLTQTPNFPEKIVLAENFSLFSDIGYFACNKIYKKMLFHEMRFKKNVHFEDIQLIPQLFLKSDIIAKSEDFHYHYLERKNSISKTHSERGLDIFDAIKDVQKAFENSRYCEEKTGFRNFQILEGVYSFLAYLAFVKDEKLYLEMSDKLREFRAKHSISTLEILMYKRFGRNYLLSLSLKKIIFYVLYFLGQEKLLRKLIQTRIF